MAPCDHSKLDRSDRMTMKAAGAPEGDFRDWDTIRGWVDQVTKSLEHEPAKAHK